ncbi:hypothetical protein BFW01_g6928 [Lasiodiplodia theobromae]|nr:hypothetical protein BFW01_g6928 [Lasiodiplodia theobromae]
MNNEHDFARSVPNHLAAYIVPATPADLHNNGNEIIDCSICYFEFSPSPANKETTTTTTTTTAPMEQAVPCRPPVKLALCGHVFCRVCIMAHLNGHHQGLAPPCPMCRQPCYPQTAVANDTLSDVEVDVDDLEELGDFMVEGVRAGGGGEEDEDRGDILAFIGEDIFGVAEAGGREEEIEGDEERVEGERIEEDEEMRDYEWEDEDDEDDEEDGDFEPEKEEEVEEEYEEDDEEIDLMELSE